MIYWSLWKFQLIVYLMEVNGDHYFFHPYLGNKEYDYIGKDEKEIEKNLKDLYGYVISSNLYKKNNLFN